MVKAPGSQVGNLTFLKTQVPTAFRQRAGSVRVGAQHLGEWRLTVMTAEQTKGEFECILLEPKSSPPFQQQNL